MPFLLVGNRVSDKTPDWKPCTAPGTGVIRLPVCFYCLRVCGIPVQGVGMVLESLKQPVINGYLIAGSIVGPGGLKLVKVRLPDSDAHQ